MEQSSSKRRKLSPPPTVEANQLKENAKPTNQDGVRTSAHRASFMSPTKASLARFNPDLLPRPRSSEPRKQISRKRSSVPTRTSNVNNDEDAFNKAKGFWPNTEYSVVDARNSRTGLEDGMPTVPNGLSAAPRRKSRTPNVQITPSKLLQTQPAPNELGLPSRNTATAPQPDRHTTESAEEVEKRRDTLGNGIVIDESSMKKLPHTPTRGGLPAGVGPTECSEPSLTSTTSQLGREEPPERLKGLLFVASSRKTTEETELPPLIGKEAGPMQPAMNRTAASILGPKVFLKGLPKSAPTPEQVALQEKNLLRTQTEREVLRLGSSVLEEALLSTWRKPFTVKETAGQLKQQKRLADVSSKLLRLREDIEQLRASVEITHDVPLDSQDHHPVGAISSELSTSNRTGLSQKISIFFPFSNAVSAMPLGNVHDAWTKEPEGIVKVKNSNFQGGFTEDSEVLLQSHDVDFLSDKSVFTTAQIIFDGMTLEIYNMKLHRTGQFNPHELKSWPFVDLREKKLASVGTALHRCSYVVERRAACWRSCQERFPDLVLPPSDYRTIDLQSIKFRRQLLCLAIQWTIEIKRDGEAESTLLINTDFPPMWRKEGIISGREVEDVREAFDLLVRERGVTEAIAVIVKLLFPIE